ncbi:MAG: HYR domain-containing protein [bacterium]
MVRFAALLLASLMLVLLVGVAFGDNMADFVRENEPEGREFEVFQVEDIAVHFHQRMVGFARVQGDYIVYQFEGDTGELLARKSHWRDDIPAELPDLLLDIAQAEAMVDGEVQSAKLYYISPDSPVFPIEPTPQNPCWVVKSLVDGYIRLTVIDAVEGGILGYGVPPPIDAFSLTGPTDHSPCSGSWDAYYQDAENWFNTMGYSTETAVWPDEAKVQSHIASNTTAMFYELAHGGSDHFASGCPNGNDYDLTVPSEIEAWIQDYQAIPFVFIGSCGGMCNTGDNTLSFEFRKGSTVETVTVGYCHMDQPQCDDCWSDWSLLWQQALFGYMNAGWTVRDAFIQALADYPVCAAGQCMRFAGDETFAVVPVVPRRFNDPPVALCHDVTVSADANCQGVASIDNGTYDPDGDPIDITIDPAPPYSLGVTPVTLGVADDHGWESYCTANVTVVDDTPPDITCPSPITVEGTDVCGTPSSDSQLSAFFAGVWTSDNCTAVPDVTDDRPVCFPMGATTVTFTSTDDAGNSNSCTSDVTVVDTTPPDITCPDDIQVACNGPQGTYADDPQLDDFWAGVSATDIVDPNPVITNDAPDLFPIGTTAVEFKATDFSDNFSTCTAYVTVVDNGIDLWLTDLIVNPGENVLVPVYVQDVTGWGVMGFDMEICWCETPAGLLQYEYCVPGEVMTNSGWGDPACNICDPGCVSIAAAGAVPLTGEGVLFYLKFHVSTLAKPCMCCDLWFDSVDIYDPETPLFACWQNGSVCVDWCDVAGCMKYWKCCPDGCGGYFYPIPLVGVQVHLYDSCSGPLGTTFTGDDGCYGFDCLEPLGQDCHFEVSVDYCRIPACVNPFDASLILRYLACLDNLDDCPFTYNGGTVYPQQAAADVTCSGDITSYDASVLLQYFVGLIPALPCPDPWVFYPMGTNGSMVYACPGTVDYMGVLKGDVNGCLECGFSPAFASDPVQVALGLPVDLGDRIEIPVLVAGAYGIFSSSFDLVYSSEDLSVVSALATGLATGSMTAHNATGDEIIFAMAGAEAFAGTGEVARITFGKVDPDADASSVELTAVVFNDGEPPAEIGTSAGVPTETAGTFLGRAVPNPFTQGTMINFEMAEAGQVSLEIYNVEGQLIRTLVSGSVNAGPHSVLWNGKDNTGRMAARGVYFCSMEADGYRATEKIVFMK